MDPVEQVRAWLTEIPTLTAELANYRTPGSAPPDPDARKPIGGAAPLPISVNVFDLLDTRDKGHQPDDPIALATGRLGVLPWLGAWVSLVHVELEDLGHTPPICCPNRQHTIPGETAWLHTHTPEILQLHPDERDTQGHIIRRGFHRELERLWKALRAACGISNRPPYIPKCPTCSWPVEGVYTDATDHEGQPLLAYWRCTGCPKTWQHTAEIQRLVLTQPPLTLRRIATLLDLPFRDLYRWRDEGRFTQAATNGRGGKLFEVEHVRRAAQTVAKAKHPKRAGS